MCFEKTALLTRLIFCNKHRNKRSFQKKFQTFNNNGSSERRKRAICYLYCSIVKMDADFLIEAERTHGCLRITSDENVFYNLPHPSYIGLSVLGEPFARFQSDFSGRLRTFDYFELQRCIGWLLREMNWKASFKPNWNSTK